MSFIKSVSAFDKDRLCGRKSRLHYIDGVLLVLELGMRDKKYSYRLLGYLEKLRETYRGWKWQSAKGGTIATTSINGQDGASFNSAQGGNGWRGAQTLE